MNFEAEIHTIKAELQLSRAASRQAFAEVHHRFDSLKSSVVDLELRIDEQYGVFDRWVDTLTQAFEARFAGVEAGHEDLRRRVEALEKKQPPP